jgi:hypothetical protein
MLRFAELVIKAAVPPDDTFTVPRAERLFRRHREQQGRQHDGLCIAGEMML